MRAASPLRTPKGMPLPPLPAANLIDRLVTFFSPVAGLRRHQARSALALSGGYVGAGYDHSALKTWATSIGSADADTIGDLETLRGRTADLDRNDAVARAAVNTKVTNIVGAGLTPRPRIDREYLKLSDEAADAWERQAARIWAHTARRVDVERNLPFSALSEIALRGRLVRGDCFGVRRYLKRQGDLLGFKLQLVEADRVATPPGKVDGLLENGSRVVDGVEFDANGVRVAYHIARAHPGERGLAAMQATEFDRVPAFGPQSGEQLVYHVFKPERPGQRRGVPMLAPVIVLLKQLSRWTEAELMSTPLRPPCTSSHRPIGRPRQVVDTAEPARQLEPPGAVEITSLDVRQALAGWIAGTNGVRDALPIRGQRGCPDVAP